ncbi:MAG TPA: TonB family protein, partial [Polyangiales bacterium]|nr:TonB family protein [Polyangiales bacterium]
MRFIQGRRALLCAAMLWAVLSPVAQLQAQTVPGNPEPAEPAPPAQPAPPGSPAQPGEAPKGPVLVAPKLKQFVEATYPPDAAAQGIAGRVELSLVIGVDGTVTEATVLTPAGHGFDEAALEAGKKLTFEPATRDGQPIVARIAFPYVFEIKVAEPPPPAVEAPPPPAKLEGTVISSDDKKPLAGVEVIVSSVERELTRRGVTDADGKFAFDDLVGGNYTVQLSKKDWTQQSATEELKAGEATTIGFQLVPAEDPEAFHAVARVPPPPREVTRRTIEKEALTRIPGTRGDALRTIELMPGVARPPLGAGFLIVRGSAPYDTQVMLEGVPVPLLYHFGGLTSFINSRLLESVDFYPGNFSVRYGRRRGGIIEANLADPATDRLHLVADTSFIDGSVLVQGPISEDWGFAAAVRRSWIDLVFESVLSSSDVNALAAPVYYDYQA